MFKRFGDARNTTTVFAWHHIDAWPYCERFERSKAAGENSAIIWLTVAAHLVNFKT